MPVIWSWSPSALGRLMTGLSERRLRLDSVAFWVAAVEAWALLGGVPAAKLLQRFGLLPNLFGLTLPLRAWAVCVAAWLTTVIVGSTTTQLLFRRCTGRQFFEDRAVYAAFHGFAMERLVPCGALVATALGYALIAGTSSIFQRFWYFLATAALVTFCAIRLIVPLVFRSAMRRCDIERQQGIWPVSEESSSQQHEAEAEPVRKVVLEDVPSVRDLAERARAALQVGHYEIALRQYRQVTGLNPDNDEANYWVAYLTHKLARTPEELALALCLYDRALELNTSRTDAYRNRARCRLAAGDHWRPRSDLMAHRDRVHLSEKTYRLAIADLHEALRLTRATSDLHVDLALTLVAQGQGGFGEVMMAPGDALSNLTVALMDQPSNVRAYFYKGQLFEYVFRDRRRAMDAYEHCEYRSSVDLECLPEPVGHIRRRLKRLRFHLAGWMDFWAGFLLRMVTLAWLLNPVLAGVLHDQSRRASTSLDSHIVLQMVMGLAAVATIWVAIFGFIPRRVAQGFYRADLIGGGGLYGLWFALVLALNGRGSLYAPSAVELGLTAAAAILLVYAWMAPEEWLDQQAISRQFRDPVPFDSTRGT